MAIANTKYKTGSVLPEPAQFLIVYATLLDAKRIVDTDANQVRIQLDILGSTP